MHEPKELPSAQELQPNDQRAKLAITLVWIVMALNMLSLGSGYYSYQLLCQIEEGIEVPLDVASKSDLLELVIAIGYLVAFVISGVMFLRWFTRAYSNLKLRTPYTDHTMTWVWASWFVPIISAFKPFKIMSELYRRTSTLLSEAGADLQNRHTSAVLGWWWALWLVSNVVTNASFRYSMTAESVEELINVAIINLIDNAIGIPLAVITVKVIHDYARLESRLFEIDQAVVVDDTMLPLTDTDPSEQPS